MVTAFSIAPALLAVSIAQREISTWTIVRRGASSFAALSDNLAIYDFAAAILKTSKRNLYKFPAVVEEYLIRNTGGATFDMFVAACSTCNEEIDENDNVIIDEED